MLIRIFFKQTEYEIFQTNPTIHTTTLGEIRTHNLRNTHTLTQITCARQVRALQKCKHAFHRRWSRALLNTHCEHMLSMAYPPRCYRRRVSGLDSSSVGRCDWCSHDREICNERGGREGWDGLCMTKKNRGFDNNRLLPVVPHWSPNLSYVLCAATSFVGAVMIAPDQTINLIMMKVLLTPSRCL